MKNLLTFFIFTIFFSGICLAQTPQKMSYQAVIRDNAGTLIANTVIGIQISILQTTSTGVSVYVERQTPTSNTNGLISIEIGTGTVISGVFNTINWGADTYFIKSEADPLGGTTYTVTGTTQILSVPYALYAANSATSTNGWNINGNTNTNAANFIGTTSNNDVIFKRNNIESGRINANNISLSTTLLAQSIGIGTTAPVGELDIVSSQAVTNALDQQLISALTLATPITTSVWQSFTAGISGTLARLDLSARTPTGILPSSGTLRIYSGTGTSGALLSTQAVSFVGAAFQPFTIVNTVNVVAGSVYTFELSVPVATMAWVRISSGDFYPNGVSSEDVNRDLGFRTYVNYAINVSALGVNDGKVGVGTNVPTSKLDVIGTTKTTNLQITSGATNNFVLKSDASGNASWVNPSIFTVPETDPKVGTLTTNKIPFWNGTSLTNGAIWDYGTSISVFGNAGIIGKLGIGTNAPNGELDIITGTNIFTVRNGNVGIDTNAPTEKLDVIGKTKTTDIQITNGAANGLILRSDANGNGSWVNPSGFAIVEIDPKVTTTTTNKIPKWSGTTLTDGIIIDNGIGIGIGTNSPTEMLDVIGKTKTTNLQITNGASDGFLLKSDANGNASWASPSTAETDPKVGTLTTNKIPFWNGTSLTNGAIWDYGNSISVFGNAGIIGKLGIGTNAPDGDLDIFSGAATATVLDQQETNYNVQSGGASEWQSFTAGITGSLTKIDIGIGGIVASAGTLRIYAGEGTSGALLSTTQITFQPTPSPSVGVNWQSFVLAIFVPVTAGQVYTFQTNSPSASYYLSNSGTYPNGRHRISALYDVAFRTYVSQLNSTNTFTVRNGNVGIGVAAPLAQLEVNGTAKTTNLQVTNGASSGYVLSSDNSGNGTWSNINSLGITETDPKVGIISTTGVPKWNGTTLTDGLISDSGSGVGIGFPPRNMLTVAGDADFFGSVGIGVHPPTAKLDVLGTTKSVNLEVAATTRTTNFQLTNGAANNFILKSDVTGNASWVNVNTLAVTAEIDPQVGTISTNRIPRWDGSSLTNGIITDNGTNVGIGMTTPNAPLQFDNTVANRKIVLYEDANNDHQYYGFGINSGALRYQANSHVFFAGINSSTSRELMRIQNNGNVGIGVTNAEARLHVAGGAITAPFEPRAYFNVAGGIISNTNNSGNVVIRADGWIWANGGGFVATSDARIKNIKGITNNAKDLEVLSKIEITDYKYKDEISNGTTLQKKVIAQQLKSIYPTAVNNGVGVIPSVFEVAKSIKVVANRTEITTNKAHDFKTGDEVKLILDKSGEKTLIVTVFDATTFFIDEIITESIFIYGKKVNDLLNVDYDALTTLNISATQELIKRIQALEKENNTLKSENMQNNNAIKAMLNDIKSIKAQLNTGNGVAGR